jgi:hypothetical protein
MNEPTNRPLNKRLDDRTLEDRLVAEAAGHCPAFSEALHARIMQRITTSPAAEPHAMRMYSIRPLLLAIAAAAALALGAFILADHATTRSARTIASTKTVPSVPAISNPVRALDGPIVSEWTTARYAYLDRDGERLIGYVGRQLDFMPRKQ